MSGLVQRYGEWAIVTGASDGIGEAFARELAEKGLNLVLVARRERRLQRLAEELKLLHGISTQVVALDLSDQDTAAVLLERVRHLDIGLCVAAAGFGTSGEFGDIPLEAELNMIDVNCRAVLALTHGFARLFKRRDKGALILLGSLVGFQGTPRAAHYAATKAYIQTLAEGIRVELQAHNVDVLSVAPGPVKSGFAARADMVMGGADLPEAVARGALKALGRGFTVRPGLLGKLLGYGMCITPRWGRIQIMKLVMGSMTRHQTSQSGAKS